jgi:hypothetical protein
VVSKESATRGTDEVRGFEADHISLVTPDSTESPIFVWVRNAIVARESKVLASTQLPDGLLREPDYERNREEEAVKKEHTVEESVETAADFVLGPGTVRVDRDTFASRRPSSCTYRPGPSWSFTTAPSSIATGFLLPAAS